MSQEDNRNSKRIAKNVIMLYFRMFLVMAVGLYTSRVILKNLGVEDFGIYNAVGGIVAMFTMLTGSLTGAIQRFFSFELGKNDTNRLKSVFSASVLIQIIMALVVVLLAETVGMWFLNNKMTIPADRIQAANWILHFSVGSFITGLISIPYTAMIIAHEKMSAFAYVSLFEVFCKLGIAISISFSPIDNLIFYAFLMFVVSLLVRLVYGTYCKKSFSESQFHFNFDMEVLKKMLSFAGWNFIGVTGGILQEHGGNIVMNMFCGPLVNAARGVAFQVNAAVQSFSNNFMTALNPQITKSYACGNYSYMMQLTFQGARLSFYTMLLVSMPVLVNADFLLELWLEKVPDYAIAFVQLVIVFSLIESLSSPLITVMLATGNIRNYQIIVGGMKALNLPASYVFLRNGFSPVFVYFIAISFALLCLGARLILLKKMVNLDVVAYLCKVCINVFIVSVCAFSVPLLVKINVPNDSYVMSLMMVLLSLISVIVFELFVGCSSQERMLVKNKILSVLAKIRK